MRWTALLITLLVLLIAGCDLSRTFEVRGRVVGFGNDGRTVIVEHEDVQGLMPAMTMPFQTDGTPALARLEIGDAVGFSYVVAPESTWIYSLERLPDSAVARSPAGDNTPSDYVPEGTSVLIAGDTVPDFTLVDQAGDTLRMSDYAGQTVVLTFIYTRCPIPEYCPLLSQRFKTLQPRLQERYGPDVQLLSVSIDPAYDTPDVLRAYAQRYTDNLETWTFATGTLEQVARVAGLFGLYYEPSGEAVIDHSLATAVIDPAGRVGRVWRDNDWTPEDALRAVARAEGVDEGVGKEAL
ncbi:MAG: SCO family protein [Rhodothermales bacterium]